MRHEVATLSRSDSKTTPVGHEKNAMRVLIATDAWQPQVTGVVRTLTSLARTAKGLGVDIEFLSPDGFRTFPLPTYPGLRLAWSRRTHIGQPNEQNPPHPLHIHTHRPRAQPG